MNPRQAMMMQITPNFKAKMRQLLLGALIALTGFFASAPAGIAQSGAPSIIRDTDIENVLKAWAAPLQKAAGIGEIQIILVQSTQLNAFVAGGKNIFVYTGLIDRTANPGELLGVMAHEMGHIAGGHLIANRAAMERASYESILGMVLGIGAAIASGNSSAANAVMSGSSSMAMNKYLAHSRVKESSADQAAIRYLTQSNIDPEGLSTFLEKLASEELLPATQQSQYMRTHPITRDRIEAVFNQIDKSGIKGKGFSVDWIEQHARIKAKLLGFISPQQVAWTYDDHDQSIAAKYARAIAAYRLNDIQGALKMIDVLIAAEPDNPYFQELKGQVLVESSRVTEGIPYYRKSVEILPNAPLLRVSLAHALIESGDDPARLEEAITHLQRAQKTEDRSTRIHRLLATAYGRMGQESKAKLALAEEAVLQMNLTYAQSLAEAAQKSFKDGSADWVKARDVLLQIETLKRDKDQ
jgi:predicted Zn-dependent protease